eukprot:7948487-Ditylum_brightwellii.AAC.1
MSHRYPTSLQDDSSESSDDSHESESDTNPELFPPQQGRNGKKNKNPFSSSEEEFSSDDSEEDSMSYSSFEKPNLAARPTPSAP